MQLKRVPAFIIRLVFIVSLLFMLSDAYINYTISLYIFNYILLLLSSYIIIKYDKLLVDMFFEKK